MPASMALSWAMSRCRMAARKASGLAFNAARSRAIRLACAWAVLDLGQAPLQFGQALEESGCVIAAMARRLLASRCIPSGRGPRRIMGPGVGISRPTEGKAWHCAAGWPCRYAAKTCRLRPPPGRAQCHRSRPGLGQFRVGRHGRQFALPEGDPILGQLVQVRGRFHSFQSFGVKRAFI